MTPSRPPKRPQGENAARGTTPAAPSQTSAVLARLLGAFEGLVVLRRLIGTPPAATGGVASDFLYGDGASACFLYRVDAAWGRVKDILATPSDLDRGAIRVVYETLVEAHADLAVAPGELMWGNPGEAAQRAGSAWLHELSCVLEATLSQLRDLVVASGNDGRRRAMMDRNTREEGRDGGVSIL